MAVSFHKPIFLTLAQLTASAKSLCSSGEVEGSAELKAVANHQHHKLGSINKHQNICLHIDELNNLLASKVAKIDS